MKFCRHFERFAANLVGCLSVKEYWFEYLGTRVTEGKFANQRPFKTACINFWSGSFIRLFRFSHIQNERLPSNYNLLIRSITSFTFSTITFFAPQNNSKTTAFFRYKNKIIPSRTTTGSPHFKAFIQKLAVVLP